MICFFSSVVGSVVSCLRQCLRDHLAKTEIFRANDERKNLLSSMVTTVYFRSRCGDFVLAGNELGAPVRQSRDCFSIADASVIERRWS